MAVHNGCCDELGWPRDAVCRRNVDRVVERPGMIQMGVPESDDARFTCFQHILGLCTPSSLVQFILQCSIG